MLLAAVMAGAGWLAAMVAGALAANALAQALAALRAGSALPGTVPGLLLMLPAALWLLAVADRPVLPALAGAILSLPLLMLVWWAAGGLRRGR